MIKFIFYYFAAGLALGSFINVCIYRWPRNLSVVYPERSFCPWCEGKIHWFQNIPVFSFLFLKGRCAKCFSHISARYVLVEILTAILCALIPVTARLSGVFNGLSEAAVIFVVVVTTFTDFEWKIIPDEAVVILFVTGIVCFVINTFYFKSISFSLNIKQSLFGLSLGFFPPLVVSFLGRLVWGKEVLGMGDVKLLAGYGFLFGATHLFEIIYWAILMGGIVSLLGLLSGVFKRKQYIPFGPFINLAVCMTLFLNLDALFFFQLINFF